MSKTKIASLLDDYGDGIHGTPVYSDTGEYYFINGNNLNDGRIYITDDTLKIDVSEYLRIKRPLNENTLLMSINGTLGKIALFRGEKIALGKSACFLNATSTINRDFIRWVLSTTAFRQYMMQVAHGSTIKNLAPSQIAEYEFQDVQDKEHVVHLLNSLDNKIDLNNRISAELEAMAKTLYDYWFVQFDFPDENGKPYRTSDGAMEWCQELVREVPKGWKVGNLYDIADYINGLACQNFRPAEGEESLPVIKIKEMHDGITLDTERVSARIPEKNIINDGDILFSWSATLEAMYWTGGKGGLNQHIFKVVPKAPYQKEFVYNQLSSYIINFVKMAEARKTTMGHITSDHLQQSRIVLPPVPVLRQFHDEVSAQHQMIIKCRKENRELEKLRDWLLPMLMNGQAYVKVGGDESV